MVFYSDYFKHRSDCKRKQQQRADRLASLPSLYHAPIQRRDQEIYDAPIADLVSRVQSSQLSPLDILHAYGKTAVKAHARTNCITEFLLPEAEDYESKTNLSGPLAGIPISLKDTIHVAGFDTSVGYSQHTFKPQAQDGTLVQLLREAGAIPFAKTNIPISLLSFESTNDVWGRTTNPHNARYSPGGSTGGEAALLALGGSRIGIGSDVAGSVRAPAHFSGCYSLRCSTGRWPKMGNNTSMPGQEGIPSVFSPMTRTLDDLVYFTRAFISTKPWRLDHSVHPLEWRHEAETQARQAKNLRIGILRTDGVIDPSPACARALESTAASLRAAGHTTVDITPPSPFRALRIASHLLNADGCATFSSFARPGEWMDSGARQMQFYMRLPRIIKYIHYLYTKYIQRDLIWAELLKSWHPYSAKAQWNLVAQRENYKAEFHAWWNEQISSGGMDFILCPPNATPAVPHDGMGIAVSSCGYTFLWNLLDYSAGIVPVTKVDAARDALPDDFDVGQLNAVARGAYKLYDAEDMAGLPVAVQVVGRRLEEEKVLGYMQVVEEANERYGEGRYPLLKI